MAKLKQVHARDLRRLFLQHKRLKEIKAQWTGAKGGIAMLVKDVLYGQYYEITIEPVEDEENVEITENIRDRARLS